jgi:hypothetical protein
MRLVSHVDSKTTSAFVALMTIDSQTPLRNITNCDISIFTMSSREACLEVNPLRYTRDPSRALRLPRGIALPCLFLESSDRPLHDSGLINSCFCARVY